jgi:hypothetical protein
MAVPPPPSGENHSNENIVRAGTASSRRRIRWTRFRGASIASASTAEAMASDAERRPL